MTKPYRPILCLDFDGCIHGYDSGWKGPGIIPDAPVPGAGRYLLRAVQHFTVSIYSSRSRSLCGRAAMKRYVRQLLWGACLADTNEAERAWAVTQGKPGDWIPWTAYDVRDQSDHILGAIKWPWFKPPALMTIDDRAMMFNGNWSDPAYSPEAIKRFKPWNKVVGRSQGRCETTLTERFGYPACRCGTYPDNLGPCKNFEAGAHLARCVYCDHTTDCHEAIAALEPAP